MKRFLVTLALLAFPMSAFAQAKKACNIDGANGALCQGLVAWYPMEELTDSTRKNSSGYGSDLRECDGFNTPHTAAGKFGNALAANVDIVRPLQLPYAGSSFGPGFWTIAFHIKLLSTRAANSYILSTQDSSSAKEGIKVYVDTLNKIHVEAYEGETDTLKTITYSSALTLNSWFAVVIKSSPIASMGGHPGLSISVANGTFQTVAYTYNIRSNPGGTLAVGPVSGGDSSSCAAGVGDYYLDNLGFWSRAFSPADVTLFNALAVDYPF